MEASYGYVDGTGEYFIVIDTDKCDACGKCLAICPQGVFELAPDDWGKVSARVKEAVVSRISYVCPGFNSECGQRPENCHTVCVPGKVQTFFPHCGGRRWFALGRVNSKDSTVRCTDCGRPVSFVGDMVRLNQHPAPPSER